MNRYGLALMSAALLLAACGGKQTMASKSAAAYREAQAKGVPVTGGHEHGHEMEAPATSTAAEMEHAAMDHSTMDHAAMNHSAHAAMQHDMTPGAPASNAERAPTTPQAILQPDAFDEPAASAVAEARKATGVKKE